MLIFLISQNNIRKWYDGYHFGDVGCLLSVGCDELSFGILQHEPDGQTDLAIGKIPVIMQLSDLLSTMQEAVSLRKLETLLVWRIYSAAG